MAINFDKYAQEGNRFLNSLAENLGHPNEHARVGMLLRAVLFTLRDRLTMSESLNMISQFPMFLKALYADEWKYQEKPDKFDTIEEFTKKVKSYQQQFGELDFDWKKHTEELVRIVLQELKTYLNQGEVSDITAQLPDNLAELFQKTA
ncbi:MAG: DUF2267 domain-containing protein [Spirochaetia bacterium]